MDTTIMDTIIMDITITDITDITDTTATTIMVTMVITVIMVIMVTTDAVTTDLRNPNRLFNRTSHTPFYYFYSYFSALDSFSTV